MAQAHPDRRLRIAVIGAGVSGLVAARELSSRHDVTVYESQGHIGGHVATVTVSDGRRDFDVDTGFIVFNRRNYPLFSAMLDQLGAASQPTDMSFGVRCDLSEIEYSGRSARTLFAQPANLLKPGHWRMLLDIRRFFRDGEALAESPPHVTVAEYIRQEGRSPEFAERFLKPMAAALWSSPTHAIDAFPIRFVAGFLRAHGLLQFKDRPQWEVVQGGSKRYVVALLSTFEANVRVADPVRRVGRTAEGVQVSSDHGTETYDEVVLACHADQALELLESPTDHEQAVLAAFPYQANDVVLHTDVSVLPRSRAAWASWNYHVGAQAESTPAVTYNMNLLQSLQADVTFCVSLNESGIAPDKVLRRFVYHHPVTTTAGLEARLKRASMIRHQGLSYCGAYWGYGFHEDGVCSALEVARAFGGAA